MKGLVSPAWKTQGLSLTIIAVCIGAAALYWSFFPTSKEPAASSRPKGIQQLTIGVPCGVSESAAYSMLHAIADKDQEAIVGLFDRGQAFNLKKGTRFDASSYEGDLVWGFVRSGSQTGRDCYLPAFALR